MNRQIWASILFGISLVEWFFPGFNGVLFSSSDVSAGESRIMSSILFVGGLILWYLPGKQNP